MASGICQSSSLLPCTRRPSRQAHGRQIAVRANEPNKTIREFSEKTGKVVNNAGQEAKGAAKQAEKDPMSKDFKKKLRDEYTGFGGAPNKPMGSNGFVLIAAGIAGLAVLSKLAGYI